MITSTVAKNCLACGKILKGRIDKKFCDDGCRNNYNNQQNSDSTNYIRNINNILRKNRRLIEEFIQKSGATTASVSKAKMIEAGFNFKYFTNTFKTKTGSVYFFNYEYGYLLKENDWVFLVKSKEGNE